MPASLLFLRYEVSFEKWLRPVLILYYCFVLLKSAFIVSRYICSVQCSVSH